ncbi:16S rRNA (guanine966-N2)-methyltransferase [Natronocella acetinitrilica]|uniref:Ribosomal RNA small subunit methyltransferase D n=1 Tax=Natronocella acetinitrilica TaxID=414046 RepID=A0AAE3KA93_9GAMM|nr:16S rRNA (guanine966-N2)-methyltransferase [Natronocella acetinitrilica]
MAALPGLRPTGDRIRETLFNWLQPHLAGSSCLDLFAGSGAIGLEAASRGAGEVILVEQAGAGARALQDAVRRLDAQDHVQVVNSDAIAYLQLQQRHFDIIFLDPPFDSPLLETALSVIAERDLLRPGGLAYLETPRQAQPPELPSGWALARDRQAGQVRFMLATNAGA